jgi:antitoxin HicB
MKEYEVFLEAAEEGGFTVICPALPGCVSEGDTRQEALANIRDAIEGYLEVLRKHGDTLPKVEVEIVEVAA